MLNSPIKAKNYDTGFRNSELGLRIISAVVMLVVTIALAFIGGWTFKLFSVILAGFLFYEWQSIVRQTAFDAAEALLTAGFIVLIAGVLFGFFIWAFVGFLVLGLILEVSSTGPEKNDVRWIGLGALYCASVAYSLPIMRDHSFELLMFVMLLVWATDVAAYFAGRYFGGPKLWPAVSPKKTWSGAIGGAIGAAIVAILFQIYVPSLDSSLLWLFAIFLSAISQLGDLFESSIKRRFGVKDSSQLIPGHGGFLDRMDGLMAAALVVAVIIALGPQV